jgi:hypothetical protein
MTMRFIQRFKEYICNSKERRGNQNRDSMS